MSTPPQHGFLTWEAPGRTPVVQLDFSVIDRLTVDAMRGFGVTRRRGTEVGGLLLGKIETGGVPVVRVYDYEVVPCEYSEGPSYVLSARDLEAFRSAAAKWSRKLSPDQYVVGYFRSHTREGLYLDESDAQLFREHVKDPLAVALVVKPFATRTGEAGFFLQSNGTLETGASPYEFSFLRADRAVPLQRVGSPHPDVRTQPALFSPEDSVVLRKAEPPPPPLPPSPPPHRSEIQKRVEPPPPPPKPVDVPPVRPIPALAEPRTRRTEAPPHAIFTSYVVPQTSPWRTRFLWIAFTAAVFGFGAVAGYEFAGGRLPLQPLIVFRPTTPPPPADLFSAKVTAAVQDGSVIVRWDRESEAIKSAMRGVLTITEGLGSKQVKLDFPELRNGTVIYHNTGSEVHFTLELFFKDNRTLTERVTLQIPADSKPVSPA